MNRIAFGLALFLGVGIFVGGMWAIDRFAPKSVVADGVETENPAVTVYYDTDFDVICWLYQPTTSAAGISCLSVTDLSLMSDGYRTLPK